MIHEQVRHRVSIAGLISDAVANAPLAGALVHIVSGPPAFTTRLDVVRRQLAASTQVIDQMRTATNGQFYFMDLPVGAYTLEVSQPGAGSRYGTTSVTLTITADTWAIADASAVLPTTSLRGRISDTGGRPIPMTQVRIVGSGERAFSDARGNYVITALEEGSRQITVTAQGYASFSTRVMLIRGHPVTCDVTLAATG